MNGNVTGSVTARIVLDTRDFKEAVENVKKEVKSLNTALKDAGFTTIRKQSIDSTKTINKLKKEITSLKRELELVAREKRRDAEATNNQIRIYNKQKQAIQEITREQEKQTKTIQSNLNAYTKQAKTINQIKKELAMKGEFLNNDQILKASSSFNTLEKQIQAVNQELRRYSDTNLRQATKAMNTLNRLSNTTKVNLNKPIFNATTQQLGQATRALNAFNRQLNTTPVNYAKIGMIIRNNKSPFNATNEQLKNAGTALNKFNQQLGITSRQSTKVNQGLKSNTNQIGLMGDNFHKSQDYINNMYRGLQKVRSVVISIKTIASAIGAMAIWDFAFQLVNSAKETYTAKNEMESLLERNSKVSAVGQNNFNKALDETISKFQKVNKYSLGETAASIGLEFNLNAREMEKSLKVISMIQSEYVRAGRTTEEAALAVKDILQGEFMRLSRETGIGKKDLIGYGWDGDNKNIKSLMAALEKAGKDRHWDLFASKASSVNDIIAITQSRFSEFGAELLTNVEPMIVGAFNGLIGALDSLKSGFEGLNGFWQNMVVYGALPTAIMGASTLFVSLRKNIGLVDTAMMGWHKSMLTAIFDLNKLDVVQHGFRSSLLASISGTKASTVANIGFNKSLAARVLGLQQNNVASLGLRNAMFAEQIAMRKGIDITKTSLIANTQALGLDLNRAQRLAVLTKGIEVNTAREMSRSRAILSTVTSLKFLRTAMIGITSIGIITYLSSVSTWTDRVRKSIEGFKNISENGKDMIKEAKSTWQGYKDEIKSLDEQIKEANASGNKTISLEQKKQRALEDSYTAYKNLGDIQRAYDYSREVNKRLTREERKITTRHTTELAYAYEKLGNNQYKARELSSQFWMEAKEGASNQEKALEKYGERLTNGTQHLTAHAEKLKQVGANTEEINKYMTDYDLVLTETAENWKKFNEGDLNAGLYALFGEFRLAWVDIANKPEVVKLSNMFIKSWKEFQPSLNKIVQGLEWLFDRLVDVGNWFMGNPIGRQVAMWSGLAGAVGLVAWKVKGFLPSGKNMINFFKNAKDGASSLINRLKSLGSGAKKAGDAIDESGLAPSLGKTTVKGETPKTWGKREFKSAVWNDTKNIARDYAKAAVHLAGVMLLVSEAILLLNAPMTTLAMTGAWFKTIEPQVRKGIEGLTLIAPTVTAIMIPIVAYLTVMNKYGDKFSEIGGSSGFMSAAKAIAMGMVLVTEAIGLLALPMGAFAVLGWVKSMLGDGVEKGKEAIEITSSALQSLYPVVPVFAAAIAMGVIALSGVGFVAEATVIAAGMLLVSEAVASLAMPMSSIEVLGNSGVNIDGVRKGAEKINATATALTYINNAMGSLNGIEWNLLADRVKELAGLDMKSTLTSLTSDDGVLRQLSDFNTSFEGFNFTGINSEKAGLINTAASSITAIGNNLKNVYTALKNLPDFNSGESYEGTSLEGTAYAELKEKKSGGGFTNYFDKLNTPLKELKTFINKFNDNPDFEIKQIKQERIDAINKASTMINSVKTAIDNVKTAMGSVSGANWESSMASGGWFTAIGNFFAHGKGAGVYQSSIGSSLNEMQLVLKDLTTFSQQISNYNVKDADVTPITDLASKISSEINNLVTTVNNGASKVKTSGVNLGKSLVTGVQSGIMNNKEGAYKTSEAFGNTTAKRFQKGVDIMSQYMYWELSYVKQELVNRKTELGDASYDLSSHMSTRYKDGLDMNSPGLMARATNEELGYIGGFISKAITNLPSQIKQLSTQLTSNFNPNLKTLDLSQFTQNLSTIPRLVNNAKTQTASTFNNMFNNINNNMNNITTSMQKGYTNMASKTRASLTNMKTVTLKNIGNIKSSWMSMQRALISSAENIKTQTSSKINTLKDNLGKFWNKIQHPEQLLKGNAGHPTNSNTTRRTYRPTSIKNNVSKHLNAGTPLNTIKPNKNNPLREQLAQLLQLLLHNKPAYAGNGWNYNWNKPIQNRFQKWRTNFNKYHLDEHLNVGKFTNSTFPVKGIAEIAKAYIYDAISRTSYDFYFNNKFSNPLAAWNAGAFNCADGTELVLALARAFGFNGSRGHTTWDGIGHIFARIPGLGVIDPTAIQQRRSFKASGVNYAGRPSSKHQKLGDTTHNYGDIHITINNNGKDISVDEKKLDKRMTKKIYDIITPALTTGA